MGWGGEGRGEVFSGGWEGGLGGERRRREGGRTGRFGGGVWGEEAEGELGVGEGNKGNKEGQRMAPNSTHKKCSTFGRGVVTPTTKC